MARCPAKRRGGMEIALAVAIPMQAVGRHGKLTHWRRFLRPASPACPCRSRPSRTPVRPVRRCRRPHSRRCRRRGALGEPPDLQSAEGRSGPPDEDRRHRSDRGPAGTRPLRRPKGARRTRSLAPARRRRPRRRSGRRPSRRGHGRRTGWGPPPSRSRPPATSTNTRATDPDRRGARRATS